MTMRAFAWLGMALFWLACFVFNAHAQTCTDGQVPVWSSTTKWTCASPAAQPLPAGSNLAMTVTNDTVTGTTVNKFAKLSGAPSKAIISSNGDTQDAMGICISGCGTTGSAVIAIIGQVSCVFDGATTAGNYVTIAATGGGCHDAGSAYPSSVGATYGRVLSTNGAGGTFVMELMTPDIAFQNAGNGKSKPGGSSADIQYNSSGQFAGAPLKVEDANTTAQRNGTTAQNHYFYNSFTDASNFERLRFNAASNVFNLISETKAAGSFTTPRVFNVGTTTASGSVFGIQFDTAGNVLPIIDSNQGFGSAARIWTTGFAQTWAATQSFKFQGFGSMVDASDGVLNMRTAANLGGTFGMAAATPAQITADQNNYQPLSGINSARSYFQRWSTDASHNITGLSFGQVSGETHLIVNVGAQNIVLVNESAASTAGNRFHNSTGADITLSADQAADVVYDSTTARWRVFKRN